MKRAELLIFFTLLSTATCSRPQPRSDYSPLRRRGLINDGQLLDSYTYIIAGGGNAGLVLAARLSEDSQNTVLVLEAGPTGDQVLQSIDVPGNNYYNSLWQTSYDWGYNTVPQQALDNRPIYWPRGRVLGGTTATNAMFFVRPSERETDEWKNLLSGQDGKTADNWGWESLLTAMKRTETFHPPTPERATQFSIKYGQDSHGSNGPIQASYPPYMPSSMQLWVPTLQAVGIPATEDSEGGNNIGGFITPISVNPSNWTRSYAVSGYINPLPPRSNLHILPNATVTRIIFADGSGDRRASGVEWATNRDAPKRTINVSKEVLLAAGVIGSPQILMHSGVGPKDVLDPVGIQTVVELPGVGQHVQEHLSATLNFQTGNETSGDVAASGSEFSRTPEFLSFVNNGIAYTNLSTLFGNSDRNAKQFLDEIRANTANNLNNLVPSSDGSVREGYKATAEATAKILEAGVGAMELVFGVTRPQRIELQASSQHPFSHGRLYINSSNAFDRPIIDPRYLSHPSDIVVLRQAVKLLRTIANTEPLRSVIGAEIDPGPQVQTDEQWEAWLRRAAQSQFHPLGSCAMLPRDKGGVVDSTLRVYGLANVRVVDSSVYPLELSAHLAAPTYGLAEIGSDLILNRSPYGNSTPRKSVPGFLGYGIPLLLGGLAATQGGGVA